MRNQNEDRNGLIYATGGYDNTYNFLNSVEQYSPFLTLYTFLKN